MKSMNALVRRGISRLIEAPGNPPVRAGAIPDPAPSTTRLVSFLRGLGLLVIIVNVFPASRIETAKARPGRRIG